MCVEFVNVFNLWQMAYAVLGLNWYNLPSSLGKPVSNTIRTTDFIQKRNTYILLASFQVWFSHGAAGVLASVLTEPFPRNDLGGGGADSKIM
jgi:hypothetical protein